jgi:hypothetical protein
MLVGYWEHAQLSLRIHEMIIDNLQVKEATQLHGYNQKLQV